MHDETSIVDGLLLCSQDSKSFDDFEGDAHAVIPVRVTVVGEEGQMADDLWNGERGAVSVDHWDLDTFIRERLYDWIELFRRHRIQSRKMIRIHRYRRFSAEPGCFAKSILLG